MDEEQPQEQMPAADAATPPFEGDIVQAAPSNAQNEEPHTPPIHGAEMPVDTPPLVAPEEGTNPDVSTDTPSSPAEQHIPPPNPAVIALPRFSAEDRAKARAAKQAKKDMVLAAILTHALALQERGAALTNDEVQDVTGLSDTTVAVYLRELVTRGFLLKLGKGRGVRYELAPSSL
ncbi:MAG: hypothetical protein RI911_839 [Candidatus Parcubacteria bacterium]|jgi:hypothetical protein